MFCGVGKVIVSVSAIAGAWVAAATFCGVGKTILVASPIVGARVVAAVLGGNGCVIPNAVTAATTAAATLGGVD